MSEPVKIIIVDNRDTFLDDVNTRLLLDDRNVEIAAALDSAENLHNAIGKYNPDLTVISENILDTQESWDYTDTVLIGYALTPEGKAAFKAKGIPCYGVIKNTTHLLNLLEGPIPLSDKTSEAAAKPAAKKEPAAEEKPAAKTKPAVRKKAVPVPEEPEEQEYEEEKENKSAEADTFEDETDEDTVIEDDDGDDNDTVSDKEEAVKSSHVAVKNKDKIQLLREARERETSQKKLAKRELGKELSTIKPPAHVVTAYSAKGGVGKTTVATETAVYLALTGHGRGKYQVCIVDYNIDFGDVRSTLDMDNEGPDMSLWAMDIRERIAAGENPKDIEYSKDEIYDHLQVMESTGLYVLCAPNTHEESMDIGQDELEIMLRNIVHNGDFDFVICDTGNNTRDSSFCALEAADNILLITTQDINSAACNKSALETFESIGFDMSKFSLVVNNIMSVKYTGVETKDVEDYFSDYPCVARIRHNADVVRANNMSEPIVLQPNHEMTKELRSIIAFLTGDKDLMPEPEKKSWFEKVFKKQ